MANRTIRTDKNRKAFLDALTQTGSVNGALKRFTFARSAFYAWKNSDAEFNAEIEAILAVERQHMLSDAEQGLKELIAERHPTAIIFALKTLAPDTYGDKTKIQHSGNVTHIHRDMSAFTDDEIDQLAAIADRVHGRV